MLSLSGFYNHLTSRFGNVSLLLARRTDLSNYGNCIREPPENVSMECPISLSPTALEEVKDNIKLSKSSKLTSCYYKTDYIMLYYETDFRKRLNLQQHVK